MCRVSRVGWVVVSTLLLSLASDGGSDRPPVGQATDVYIVPQTLSESQGQISDDAKSLSFLMNQTDATQQQLVSSLSNTTALVSNFSDQVRWAGLTINGSSPVSDMLRDVQRVLVSINGLVLNYTTQLSATLMSTRESVFDIQNRSRAYGASAIDDATTDGSIVSSLQGASDKFASVASAVADNVTSSVTTLAYLTPDNASYADPEYKGLLSTFRSNVEQRMRGPVAQLEAQVAGLFNAEQDIRDQAVRLTNSIASNSAGMMKFVKQSADSLAPDLQTQTQSSIDSLVSTVLADKQTVSDNVAAQLDTTFNKQLLPALSGFAMGMNTSNSYAAQGIEFLKQQISDLTNLTATLSQHSVDQLDQNGKQLAMDIGALLFDLNSQLSAVQDRFTDAATRFDQSVSDDLAVVTDQIADTNSTLANVAAVSAQALVSTLSTARDRVYSMQTDTESLVNSSLSRVGDGIDTMLVNVNSSSQAVTTSLFPADSPLAEVILNTSIPAVQSQFDQLNSTLSNVVASLNQQLDNYYSELTNVTLAAPAGIAIMLDSTQDQVAQHMTDLEAMIDSYVNSSSTDLLDMLNKAFQDNANFSSLTGSYSGSLKTRSQMNAVGSVVSDLTQMQDSLKSLLDNIKSDSADASSKLQSSAGLLQKEFSETVSSLQDQSSGLLGQILSDLDVELASALNVSQQVVLDGTQQMNQSDTAISDFIAQASAAGQSTLDEVNAALASANLTVSLPADAAALRNDFVSTMQSSSSDFLAQVGQFASSNASAAIAAAVTDETAKARDMLDNATTAASQTQADILSRINGVGASVDVTPLDVMTRCGGLNPNRNSAYSSGCLLSADINQIASQLDSDPLSQDSASTMSSAIDDVNAGAAGVVSNMNDQLNSISSKLAGMVSAFSYPGGSAYGTQPSERPANAILKAVDTKTSSSISAVTDQLVGAVSHLISKIKRFGSGGDEAGGQSQTQTHGSNLGPVENHGYSVSSGDDDASHSLLQTVSAVRDFQAQLDRIQKRASLVVSDVYGGSEISKAKSKFIAHLESNVGGSLQKAAREISSAASFASRHELLSAKEVSAALKQRYVRALLNRVLPQIQRVMELRHDDVAVHGPMVYTTLASETTLERVKAAIGAATRKIAFLKDFVSAALVVSRKTQDEQAEILKERDALVKGVQSQFKKVSSLAKAHTAEAQAAATQLTARHSKLGERFNAIATDLEAVGSEASSEFSGQWTKERGASLSPQTTSSYQDLSTLASRVGTVSGSLAKAIHSMSSLYDIPMNYGKGRHDSSAVLALRREVLDQANKVEEEARSHMKGDSPEQATVMKWLGHVKSKLEKSLLKA